MTKEEQVKEMANLMAETMLKNFGLRYKDFAEILYNAGYRKENSERIDELLTDAVDATFRGAVLRFAEKLKGRIREVAFILDDEIISWDILIDETAQKFLRSETYDRRRTNHIFIRKNNNRRA